MTNIVSIHDNHPLVGEWKSADDFSDVKVTINQDNALWKVSAIDENDNEEAEVSKINYENDQLNFTLYWPSTGRQVNYRFLLQTENTIGVTYTYTATEIWQRK